MTINLFPALKDAAPKVWTRYVTHDFVERLAAGTLPRSSFLYYLRQDYIFLVHYARAWALLAAKSEKLCELRFASEMIEENLKEAQLHVTRCREEGIARSDLENTVEDEANMAYTRYVLATGLGGDVLDLLVTLAPCCLGYGEIGQRLCRMNLDLARHPYGSWIRAYGDPSFQRLCARLQAFCDEVAARRIDGIVQRSVRWPRLLELFSSACRLEAGFWEMGSAGEGSSSARGSREQR